MARGPFEGVWKTGFRAGPLVFCLFWGRLLAHKAPESVILASRGVFFFGLPCVSILKILKSFVENSKMDEKRKETF